MFEPLESFLHSENHSKGITGSNTDKSEGFKGAQRYQIVLFILIQVIPWAQLWLNFHSIVTYRTHATS